MKMAERGYDIGDKLYQIRRMRVLTQEQLAKLSGVHVITISYIEQGHRHASARTLKRLAGALDVDVKEFVESDLD